MKQYRRKLRFRRCGERNDEAIHTCMVAPWIASLALAMTAERQQ
jgi:hypothetical protein